MLKKSVVIRSCVCGVSLLAWFFRDIGVSSVTNAAEERLFLWRFGRVAGHRTQGRSKIETRGKPPELPRGRRVETENVHLSNRFRKAKQKNNPKRNLKEKEKEKEFL